MKREMWPGTTGPAAGVPARADGSVRRTLTVDMLRPDGPDGPLVLDGRARDLASGAGGAVHSVEEGRVRLTIDFLPERKVRNIATDPVVDGIDNLVGIAAARGFRAQANALLDDAPAAPVLVAALLDEVTATTMLSRLSLLRLGVFLPRVGTRPIVGVCAGFGPDTTLTRLVMTDPNPMPISDGIVAPSLDDPADPDAWHEVARLPVGAMRRRRRYDLMPDDDDVLRIESFFRDSFVEADGTEVAIHEYGVSARVRAPDHTLLSIEAVAHVLPAPECPRALPSVQQYVGKTVEELPVFVGEELVGVSACTHLTDHVRAFGRLAPLLDRVVSDRRRRRRPSGQ